MVQYDFRFQDTEKPVSKYRSPYRVDYARVLHSPSFRRLENKTQLFPGNESDFFRNRLTHSLEVAQIAKTIADKINLDQKKKKPNINADVCEIAGLLHDLGHPPFGHNGEQALDDCMKKFGGFEGNAQTLRIITRLEKKELGELLPDGTDNRVGLNLTALVIGSILKYDNIIPPERSDSDALVKGYYETEQNIVDTIKECITNTTYPNKFKTIECSIMDIADDIAYSTYDMEDAFKAGFLTPYDMMSSDEDVIQQIIEKLEKDNIKCSLDKCRSRLYGLFAEVWGKCIDEMKMLDTFSPDYDLKALQTLLNSYQLSKEIASNGYKRSYFTSSLVQIFVEGVQYHYNEEYPQLSRVDFDEETKLLVNILKHFTYVYLINSPRLKVAENRGKEIVRGIFDKLNGEKGENLLPDDFKKLYCSLIDEKAKKRLICDFIAGMTDRYALEFYGRLHSENPQTIFKPL